MSKPEDKPEEQNSADLLSKTRDKLAAATGEFQHGLAKVKNPAERRKLAAGYLDLMQGYLGKAQLGLTRYRSKLQTREDAELPDTPNQPAPRPSPGDSKDGDSTP